jgi:hypothetical protein
VSKAWQVKSPITGNVLRLPRRKLVFWWDFVEIKQMLLAAHTVTPLIRNTYEEVRVGGE